MQHGNIKIKTKSIVSDEEHPVSQKLIEQLNKCPTFIIYVLILFTTLAMMDNKIVKYNRFVNLYENN